MKVINQIKFAYGKISQGDLLVMERFEEDMYLVAQVEYDKYQLISLATGNRYSDPVSESELQKLRVKIKSVIPYSQYQLVVQNLG